jgi:hypothetical protein
MCSFSCFFKSCLLALMWLLAAIFFQVNYMLLCCFHWRSYVAANLGGCPALLSAITSASPCFFVVSMHSRVHALVITSAQSC